ncbi:DNA polymerase I [Patescibacteria group bacterium]|nr:MAG: DNA polymerase I [Patescibacteria group bacterium]
MKSLKQDTFLVIDGNALLHRAWHAIPLLTTRDGRVVNAAYGFSMMLEKILEQFRPDYAAVAWDLPGDTFRHEAYAPYKAQRKKKEQELYDQIPLIQEILRAHGIPSLSAEGFEADDVIGTLSKTAADEGMQTLIVTGDMDSLQLVDDSTKVVSFVKGISETKTYDEAAVKERFGLTPSQLIDYKAFRGDPSDNLPGVSGIGEKSAVEMLHQFKTVDGVFAALKEGKVPEKYAKKLEGHEQTASLMRELVTIRRDVPLPGFRFEDAKAGREDLTKVVEMYRDLEFRTLLKKHMSAGVVEAPPIGAVGSGRDPLPAHRSFSEGGSSPLKRGTLVLVRSASEAEKSMDGLGPEVGVLAAVQIQQALFGPTVAVCAISDGTKTVVFPRPAKETLDAILVALESAKRVVTHDLKGLMHATGWKPDQRWSDLMVGSYVLNPGSRAHDLHSALAQLAGAKLPEFTGFNGDDELRAFGEAASHLSAAAKTLFARLEETGMKKVYLDIELPLVPVLFDMEAAGIELDVKALGKLRKTFAADLGRLRADIIKEAGEEFNVNAPAQLATILFDKLHLPTKGIKRTQSGFSTAASELEKLEDAHAIIPLVSQYRELAKLQSTYVESLPSLVRPDGRVHTTFNQTVAATGRLSSSDPNLQNIPIKTELGNKIREAFVAGRGKRLIAVDYSQIELRLAAVIAKDEPFVKAFREGADIHTRTAAEVWDVPEDKVTPEQRRSAKAINFGILYGMGPRSLARSTGMSMGEAQQFIEKYFAIHHKIREYMDATKLQAHEKGYVETLFGRRRYLPEVTSGVPMLVAMAERMAVNMPIQGTQADVVKLAMISVDHWLKTSGWPARLLLQVHDELVIECDADAVKAVSKGVKELMEGVANFEVPLTVEVEVGTSWGKMK